MKKILATGRLTDREETTKLTSVHIHKNTLEWVEENSSGNKQLVFNYLMQMGIEQVEKLNETIVIEKLKK